MFRRKIYKFICIMCGKQDCPREEYKIKVEVK